jgi:hypothetical protein
MSIQLTSTKALSIGSIGGLLTAIIGVATDPSVLHVLPAKISGTLTIVGVLITAISKQLVHDTPTA